MTAPDVTTSALGANTLNRRVSYVAITDRTTNGMVISFEERLCWPFAWRKRAVRGSCTVWHDATTGRRVGIMREGWLNSVWELARHAEVTR